jgi:hypothetical protein
MSSRVTEINRESYAARRELLQSLRGIPRPIPSTERRCRTGRPPKWRSREKRCVRKWGSRQHFCETEALSVGMIRAYQLEAALTKPRRARKRDCDKGRWGGVNCGDHHGAQVEMSAPKNSRCRTSTPVRLWSGDRERRADTGRRNLWTTLAVAWCRMPAPVMCHAVRQANAIPSIAPSTSTNASPPGRWFDRIRLALLQGQPARE